MCTWDVRFKYKMSHVNMRPSYMYVAFIPYFRFGEGFINYPFKNQH